MTHRGSDRRVVVVTGGGGGIGAAIATELGRRGDHVVTVDPLVSVDGTEVLAPSEDTTAGRIVAGGGRARASAVSVTDRDAVAGLFADLMDEHGRLDAVVNVAGITRPTGFAKGTEDDWAAVLAVHLDGYRNVLDAALPIMAAAGRGAVLGVTSGSGWRAADAGAYSCAKRAVASLTWQLGRAAPQGVSVNAISPIALTRMVTAALGRAGAGATAARRPGGSSATGGLSLAAMPAPEDLGPLGAHLVGPGVGALRGQILFAGGSEVAVVEPPRLIEVVRTSGAVSIDAVIDAVEAAFVAAEAAQATSGGSNARFGPIFDEQVDAHGPESRSSRVVVVTDRPELGAAVVARLDAHGGSARVIDAGGVTAGFDGARAALDAVARELGGVDAVVVALATPTSAPAQMATATAKADDGGWAAVLAEHAGLVGQLHTDAAWTRAVSDHATDRATDHATDRATDRDRPVRLVNLIDAATAGGRSRAQAAAQLARAAAKATEGRVAAFAVGLEDRNQVDPAAALAARLATRADVGLAGAELVVGSGWIGLRRHPRPGASIVFGGPELPPWFDAALAEVVHP